MSKQFSKKSAVDYDQASLLELWDHLVLAKVPFSTFFPDTSKFKLQLMKKTEKRRQNNYSYSIIKIPLDQRSITALKIKRNQK